MKDEITPTHKVCIGFAQETENGGIYELGNGWIHRRIIRLGGAVTTTSLMNVVNGEEYLVESENEFSIELTSPYEELTLLSSEFEFVGVSTPVWTDEAKQLRFALSAEVSGETLDVVLLYEARAGEDRMRKWLEIGSLLGWEIGEVILEDLQLTGMIESIRPIASTERGEQENTRFRYREYSDSVVEFWGCTEGIFAISPAEESEVICNIENRFTVTQIMNCSTESPVTTEPAILGAYRGLPEYGFYVYRRARALECKPKPVMLTPPDEPIGAKSAAILRAQIYNLGWQTPVTWMDSSDLYGWLNGAARLSRGEYLHIVLSLIGLLRKEEMELLESLAPDEESANAVKSAKAFMKDFGRYFPDYRHMLSEPDGEIVDAHAHFLDESGFIILINPSEETIMVDLPLNEPGIWLSLTRKHRLADWSSLSVGVPMDESKTEPGPQIGLAPYEVRIIGVNLPVE